MDNTQKKIPFDEKYPKTFDVLTTIGAVVLGIILIYFITCVLGN
jgi:hypothetical protein